MSEDLVHSIINASSDGIWGVDRAGLITFVNDVALHYFGYADGRQMIGRRAHELLHHHRADGTLYPESECPIVDAFRRGAAVQLQSETFWRGDGSPFRADVRIHPIREGGCVTGAIVAFADVRQRLEIEGARRAVELERENFRNLFQLTPEMVCILSGPEHRFEFVSTAHVAALGFDATGMTVRRAQPESTEVHNLLDQVYRTGRAATLIEHPVTLTDRVGYFNLTYTPRRDVRGAIDGIMILGREVTAQVEARTRLQESELALREFLDAVPVQLWSAHPDGTPQFFNRYWFEYTGVDPADGTEGNWPHVVHPKDLERVRGTWDASVRDGTPVRQEYRIRRAADQTYRWHISRGAPLIGADGRIVRWAGCTADIESLKQAERAAESASQSKSAFLANMSHEIRTPLGAILGFSELLRDPDLNADQREQYLQTVIRNGQSLTRIIDDILDLAKVEAGRLDIETVEFALPDLLKESLDLFRDKARRKGIYLESEVKDGVPRDVISDPTRLRQILINIVGNAVKFTTTGGVRVTVDARAHESGTATEFEVLVHDTGVGLSAAQRDKLFEPFVQADNSTTRRYGGTGLGLVLSRRLAGALGGDISIRECSEAGGCTFCITFVGRTVATASASRAREAVDAGPASRLRGVRVLLAEDSADNQFLITQVLRREGAVVEVAEDGEQAIEKARSKPVDVVLMDIQMPRVDGYVATRTLRAVGFAKPIIALTAHAMHEEREQTRAAGCDAHLTKPLNRRELIETIEHFAREP